MARGWKCARCSNDNGEGTLNCANCGLIRGGVVVQSAFTPPPAPAPSAPITPPASEASSTPPPEPWSAMPSPGWASETGHLATDAPAPGEPGTGGWVAPPAVTPNATPLWRRIPITGIFFLIVLLGGGIGGLIFNASRSSTGEISRSGDMMATDLLVGDCFDLKDPTADEITDVTARPCTEEHEYELIFTGSMAEGAYPSDDAFNAFMRGNCVGAFGSYVGRAYEDSQLDMYWLVPVQDAWNDGDRSIQCAAYHPRVNRLTTTLRGSNQ
jgi:hypothetical protein